jgi:hypothetical protein
MTKKFYLLVFVALCISARPHAQVNLGNPADLPFTVTLEEVTQTEIPAMHSFAFGQYQGWWIAIGGRINGLHGFFPFTAFPEESANSNIRLIDPENGDTYQFALNALGAAINIDPLKATNPQYAQVGETLYITGGYGRQSSSGDFVTFPYLTTVHLPTLVSKMLANTNPVSAFKQLQDNRFAVCGGEMDYLHDFFYLVGGHHFTGTYSQTPSPFFTQTYSNSIRKFKVENSANSLTVSDYSTHVDEENLHRRDFNLVPIIKANGEEALVLHGGVFRPDADLPYYKPVYITATQPVDLDESYSQIFSQYTCPVATLFDANRQTSYSIFFGGLSAHYFNTSTQTVTYDERVPFIRDISVFERLPNGSSKEYLLPIRFDALLGSNMIFVPADSVPKYANEVLNINAFPSGVASFAGYLFGGIKADIPNITTSSASNRLFKVLIQPKNISSVAPNADDERKIRIYPSLAPCGSPLYIESAASWHNCTLYNTQGQLLGTFGTDKTALSLAVQQLPSGVYWINLDGKTRKLVRY